MPYYYNPYQPQQNQSILWVRNEQEAAMYPVAPNNAVVLWDSSSPVIYLKQADASGKPNMKTYDLVERAAEQQDSYATKSELAALAGVVKDVDSVIASLKEEIESLKVKAPVKRVRKEEEE